LNISRRNLIAGATLVGIAQVLSSGYSAKTADLDELIISSNQLTTELQSDLSDEILVVDCSPLREFRNHHIPGAVHAWWQDTVDPNYPYYGATLTQGEDQRFRQELLASIGVTETSNIVAYDNSNGFRAARWIWFLRFLGMNARFLYGGLDGWIAEGYDGEAGATEIAAQSLPRVKPRDGYYLVTPQLVDRLGRGEIAIVDTRTDIERQLREPEILKTGMIPGSIHLPWDNLWDGSKSVQENITHLSQLLIPLGLESRSEIVVYANYGVDTAWSWLVLQLAGLTQTTIYDRGWVEWSNRPELPSDSI
jgi:thiosulfate/3-mercaptopyruvate sulfurtransferase